MCKNGNASSGSSTPENGNLNDKCVLITGSTSGIGIGIATCFARTGAKVMLHGRQDPESTLVKDLITKLEDLSNNTVAYTKADIANEEDCLRLVNETTEKLGKIDVVVNNAGIQFVCPAEKFPLEEWNKVIKVNLTAPFLISKAVLPGMYERGWGRLVHIGSINSLIAMPNKVAYCSSKHGLCGMSKAIALEAAQKGVTSNVICPAWVKTPLAVKQFEAYAKTRGISNEEAEKERLLQYHAAPEWIEAEDIGNLAVFLAAESSGRITGSDFPVDLGTTAH